MAHWIARVPGMLVGGFVAMAVMERYEQLARLHGVEHHGACLDPPMWRRQLDSIAEPNIQPRGISGVDFNMRTWRVVVSRRQSDNSIQTALARMSDAEMGALNVFRGVQLIWLPAPHDVSLRKNINVVSRAHAQLVILLD